MNLSMQTLVEVRAQKMDTRTATAIFYGIGVCLSALETVRLDARLKALEERHAALQDARERVN